MKSKKCSLWIRTYSVLLAIALVTVCSAPSYAEDSVNALENKTSDLESELSGLNSELKKMSAELNSVIQKMKTTTEELEQTKVELANAKAKQEAQYQSMKQRIKYIYENGDTSLLESLFSSGSMAEFLNKAHFISTINEYDRNRLENLREIQNTVAEKEAQLEKTQSSLSSLQSDLNKKEAALKAKVSDKSNELEKYSAQLAEAKAQAKAAEEAMNKQVEPALPQVQEPQNSSGGSSSSSKPPVQANASEMDLFAALIECEAGSTNYDGMLAVASVVMNRVRHRYYPNTITGVIYQSGQFSPVASGKVAKVLKRGVKASCLNVARDAVAGKNNVGDCLSFRAASTGHSGIHIGGNVFF